MAAALVLTSSSVLAEEIQSYGYDENTEIRMKGRVISFFTDEETGLKCIFVKSGARDYKVITAPEWYVNKKRLWPKQSSFVDVIGSKSYRKDGSLCIVARQIFLEHAGRIEVLRDEQLRPVWRRPEAKEFSCIATSYSRIK